MLTSTVSVVRPCSVRASSILNFCFNKKCYASIKMKMCFLCSCGGNLIEFNDVNFEKYFVKKNFNSMKLISPKEKVMLRIMLSGTESS